MKPILLRSSINSSLQLWVVVPSDKSFDEIGILLLLFFVMDKFYVLIIANKQEDNCDLILINRGDPVAFEAFWRKLGDKCTMVISGSDLMSYLSDMGNVCWFLVPELAEAINNLHHVVDNAVSDGRHIVIGTGSTQLYQAALYALSSPGGPEPISVVSAAPYYSVSQLMKSHSVTFN